MLENLNFEIPPELRELTEKQVEQTRAAYGQFMDFLIQALEVSSKAPANAMFPGIKAVQERTIEFAKENLERFFDLANELTRAKDIREVLTLLEKGLVACFFPPVSRLSGI